MKNSYRTKAREESDFQHDIMNHTAVIEGFQFIQDALKVLPPSIPLILGEVGNTLGNGSSKGILLEAVLGSALWQVDFSLWSMFIVCKLLVDPGLKLLLINLDMGLLE